MISTGMAMAMTKILRFCQEGRVAEQVDLQGSERWRRQTVNIVSLGSPVSNKVSAELYRELSARYHIPYEVKYDVSFQCNYTLFFNNLASKY